MKRFILVLGFMVLLFGISGCSDDSACDRAEENAAQKCEEQGDEARDCKVLSREKDFLNNTTTCTAQCTCYESSGNSSEYETSSSCTFDEEGNEIENSEIE